MKIQIVPLTQSWTAGCDLWVTSAPDKSAWSRRMDWYLNFRITKGFQSSMPERSPGLETLLSKVKWAIPRKKDWNTDTLLIAANQSLPCKWVLVLEDLNPDSITDGLKKLLKIWKDFNQPKMRLFLPSQLNQDALRKSWSSLELPQDFELVLE